MSIIDSIKKNPKVFIPFIAAGGVLGAIALFKNKAGAAGAPAGSETEDKEKIAANLEGIMNNQAQQFTQAIQQERADMLGILEDKEANFQTALSQKETEYQELLDETIGVYESKISKLTSDFNTGFVAISTAVSNMQKEEQEPIYVYAPPGDIEGALRDAAGYTNVIVKPASEFDPTKVGSSKTYVLGGDKAAGGILNTGSATRIGGKDRQETEMKLREELKKGGK
jgi:hypothetical protein